MTLIQDYINWKISQPETAKIIDVISIDPADYQYYYNNGYQYLFEIDTTPETNDIPTTQPE